MADPITYPVSGGVDSCDATQLLKAYFLKLFDRTYPLGYLFPLKVVPNSGYELFKCFAQVGERVSLAIERLECGSIIIFSNLGAKATGSVVISRPTVAAGAVTVKMGTVVTTDDRRDFVLLADVAFAALDFGPHTVAVQAIASGFEYNVPGASTSAGGELLPGAINQFQALMTTPSYGDISFVVTQPTATTGGAAAMLEGLGHDRGVEYNGEDIDLYKLRVRSLPDVDSPGAIRRLLDNVFGDQHYCFREVGTPSLRGVFYDGDQTTGDVTKIDFYDENSLVFDGVTINANFRFQEPVLLVDAANNVFADGWFGSLEAGNTRFFFIPRTTRSRAVAGAGYKIVSKIGGPGQFNPATVVPTPNSVIARRFRLMFDYMEFRAFFLIGVPRLTDGEFGIPYDAGHPYNAYDNIAPFQNFYDGFPYIAFQFYQSVWNQVENTKAAGVGFDLYIEDIGCV